MRLLFLILFVLVTTNIYSQGLVFDNDLYQKRILLKRDRADKYPKSFSLKAYAPYVFAQQNSTCVAHAIAVARTIAFAYNRKLTDIKVVSANVFSPHWVYFRNKQLGDDNCSKGLNLENAINDLIVHGIPRLVSVEYKEYYPFTKTVLCNYYPDSYNNDTNEALKYKIDEVYRINDLDGIKLALSKGMPIVVGMLIPDSFTKSISKLWIPTANDNLENSFGHSMVIVGYDDNAYGGSVEIMNSWGVNWGDHGFIRIKYSDFLKFTLGAYGFFEQFSLGSNHIIAKDTSFSKDLKLSKSIDLKSKSLYSKHLKDFEPSVK